MFSRDSQARCVGERGYDACVRVGDERHGSTGVRGFQGIGAAKISVLATLACLLALALAGTASAASTHEYLSGLSAKLTAGAPKVAGLTVGPGKTVGEPGELFTVETKELSGNRLVKLSLSSGALVSQFPEVPALSYYQAVAVAHSTGDVYLAADDGGTTGSIAVFNSAGTLQKIWQGADTANGGFGCFDCRVDEHTVAVDNSANVETSGDVYVASPVKKVVDVFKPGAGGSEETIPVHEITGISPSEPFGEPTAVAVDESNSDVLVVDGSVVDVFKPTVLGEYELAFQIAGTPSVAFPHRVTGIATGGGEGNGDIYVAIAEGAVYQFSSEGVFLDKLTGISRSEPFTSPAGVAVDPSSGDVLVDDNYGSAIDAFGPSIVIPDVATATASEVLATHVTLNGTVKLDGAGPAACSFEYGTTRSYGQSAPCIPATVTEAEETAHNDEPVPVEKTIEGLEPDTTYYYRVSALNDNSTHFASTGNGAEDEGEAKTSGPGLEGESASEVSASAASLDATINPVGSPASYFFQYNTTGTGGCAPEPGTAGCTTIPLSPEEIGSGSEPVDVSQHIQNLEPGTTYHYRVVVLSEPKHGEIERFADRDATFTTQPPPAGFKLTDEREWELVSPPDKQGATILDINEEGIFQAAASGDAFTYVASKPTEEEAPGYFENEQILSTRVGGGGAAGNQSGWSTQEIALAHHEPVAVSIGTGYEYRAFSEDLSLGLVEPFGEFTSQKPDVFPPDSERAPYLRHDLTCTSEPATCLRPLVTEAPGYEDVEPGIQFGGPPARSFGDVAFVGASPDLAHVIVKAEVSLRAGVSGGALYEFSAGLPEREALQPVSVLPKAEGGAVAGGELGGHDELNGSNARGAVSADGSRVVWEDGYGLYLTDTALPETAADRSGRLDLPQAQCLKENTCGGGEVKPVFQIANSDGSRVFFSDSQQLLPGGGGLYECAVSVGPSGPTCALHAVAPGASVLGDVLGSSEDGNSVYFVSNSVVGDGTVRGAAPGDCPSVTDGAASQSCNLYMVHYDTGSGSWEAPVFIAALSGADQPDWSSEVVAQTARVSSNGQWVAFMSQRPLTGYDNEDVTSKKPGERSDEEVFLYDAGEHRLVCASCDPTGARPHGEEVGGDGRLGTGFHVWDFSTWLAGNIPGGTAFKSGRARYQSRVLSGEGRLFFNSSDALVPQDINRQEDVYEFEPDAVGTCSSSASTGSTAYEPSRPFEADGARGESAAGCVSLISSGTSATESAFLDASASGNDVFFLTAEKLVPADADTALDVYDAHVCGAEGVPCIQAAVSPPECTTADACRAAAALQPGIFGAPASATFSGPGNLAPTPAVVKKGTKKAVQCKRGFVKNKNGKCVKRPKKQKTKAKRASNNRRTK